MKKESFKLIYRHYGKNDTFIEIYEGKNKRDYKVIDREKDKIYYIKAPKLYAYTENDLLELYRWIINNKQLHKAKENIKEKAIRFLKNIS